MTTPYDPTTPDPADPGFRGPDVPTPPVPSAQQPQYGSPVPQGQPGQFPPSAPVGSGYQAPVTEKTDGVSIAALVTGLLTMGIVPLILGIIGMTRTGAGKRKGRGMAIAGIVLGVLGIAFWVVISMVIVFAAQSVVNDVNDTNADNCRAGVMGACDQLAKGSRLTDRQKEIADTCGGEQPAGSTGKCVQLGNAAPVPENTPDAAGAGDSGSLDNSAAKDQLDSMTEDDLRSMYDQQMPDSVKDVAKDPAQKKAMIKSALSMCESGSAASCDIVAYIADKKSDADAYKKADTCGGTYPKGGYALKCQMAESLK